MINKDEMIILFPKMRGYVDKPQQRHLLSFMVSKTKKGTDQLRVHIGIEIMEKFQFNKTDKLLFGCHKDDPTMWYFFLDPRGHSMKKAKSGRYYQSTMTWKFENIGKKMFNSFTKDQNIDIDQKSITVDVSGHFRSNELVLKKHV